MDVLVSALVVDVQEELGDGICRVEGTVGEFLPGLEEFFLGDACLVGPAGMCVDVQKCRVGGVRKELCGGMSYDLVFPLISLQDADDAGQRRGFDQEVEVDHGTERWIRVDQATVGASFVEQEVDVVGLEERVKLMKEGILYHGEQGVGLVGFLEGLLLLFGEVGKERGVLGFFVEQEGQQAVVRRGGEASVQREQIRLFFSMCRG